jgi:hypothetical protein
MPLTRAISGLVNTNIVDLGTGTNIDCSAGTYFTKTITGNTTLTVSNVPSDRTYAFTLRLTFIGGSVTWWSGVTWAGYNIPMLTTNTIAMFVTDNGGTIWRASSLSYAAY